MIRVSSRDSVEALLPGVLAKGDYKPGAGGGSVWLGPVWDEADRGKRGAGVVGMTFFSPWRQLGLISALLTWDLAVVWSDVTSQYLPLPWVSWS